MNNGWVKVPRTILDDSVFQNANLLRLYFWLLLRASYKERSVSVGLKSVDLKPGQLVYGLNSTVAELKLPRSTLWRHMKALEQRGLITITPNRNFSIVELQGNLEWSSDETDAETNKKRKKGKKEKKNIFARRRNGFLNYTDEHADFSDVEAAALNRRRKIAPTS